MKTKIRLAVALAVLTPAASAQLMVPISQTRLVDARASVNIAPYTVDQNSAPDYGPFSYSAMAAQQSPGGLIRSSATASQTSTIGAASIRAMGNARANTVSALSDSDGRSSCVVDFTVSQPVHYRAFGTVHSDFTAHAEFRLSGDSFINGSGSYYFLRQTAQFGESYPFDYSGVLPAGTYRFDATGQATGQDGSAWGQGAASFDVQLELTAVSNMDCIPTANSTGEPALLSTTRRPWPNSFEIEVSGGVPGQFGLMVYGQLRAPMPLGDGLLCVGQPLVRFPFVQSFGVAGTLSSPVSTTTAPFNSGPGAIAFGSTWSFQFWYRDSGTQLAGFNLSNVLTVTFIP